MSVNTDRNEVYNHVASHSPVCHYIAWSLGLCNEKCVTAPGSMLNIENFCFDLQFYEIRLKKTLYYLDTQDYTVH